jgi:hypothetical protein
VAAHLQGAKPAAPWCRDLTPETRRAILCSCARKSRPDGETDVWGSGPRRRVRGAAAVAVCCSSEGLPPRKGPACQRAPAVSLRALPGTAGRDGCKERERAADSWFDERTGQPLGDIAGRVAKTDERSCPLTRLGARQRRSFAPLGSIFAPFFRGSIAHAYGDPNGAPAISKKRVRAADAQAADGHRRPLPSKTT